MACIYDDYNIVDPSAVVAVFKPDSAELRFLTLGLASGQTVTCRFASQEARDGFYKELLSAMEKD